MTEVPRGRSALGERALGQDRVPETIVTTVGSE